MLCILEHLYFVESGVVNNKDHTKNQGPGFFNNSRASMVSDFLVN